MAATKQTVRDLRRINRRVVLRQLYFDGSLSRLELSQRSGLSPSTVTNVVNELLGEGIFIDSGLEESEGGRPRTILSVNSAYGYFIGVDVGETEVKIELFDLMLHNQNIIDRFCNVTGNQVETLVQNIINGITALLVKANLPSSKVIGVGIGVPGIVERSKEVMVSAPIWDWQPTPLLAMLKKHLHLPFYVDNGAKAMALAEMWFGAGRGVESLAVLLLGTGVGAGIIANGSLYRGITNSAGEWGHTTIQLDGKKCRCGSFGCLESYIGAPGIIQRFQELAPNNPLTQVDDQIAAITAIVLAAKQEDAVALQVLKETAHYLGAGIGNLVNVFNPQRVILGGWVGLQIGEFILPDLKKFVERYALRQPLAAMDFRFCELDIDSVCQGAAAVALEDFLATADKFANTATTKTKALSKAG